MQNDRSLPYPVQKLEYWKKFLVACIALQMVLLICSLPGQRVQGDEAAFAEFAYWQAQDGYVHSEQFRGLAGYETQIMLYHKLFEALGAVMILIFGYGLWPLRSLSLIATAMIIFLMWREYRRGDGIALDDVPADNLEFLLAAGFFLLTPLVFKFAKFYRPEMIQTAFGLGSFYCLRRALPDKSTRLMLLAGTLAGASMLTHLNGVIYVLAGGGLLLVFRRWRDFIWFSLAATAVFSLFFVDIIKNPDLFWWQYVDDPTFGEGERSIMSSLVKILEEHKRLFRKPEIIFTSVLFFSSYIVSLVYQWRKYREFHLYLGLLLLSLAALAPAKTTPYAILLFPFFAMQVGQVGNAVLRGKLILPRWLRLGLVVCALAFIGHSFGAAAVNTFTDKQDWVGDNRRIAEQIPPGSRVLAHMDFVLDEINNYRIAGLRLPRWRLEDWVDDPYTFDVLVRYADTTGMDAVILDQDERDFLIDLPDTIGARVGPYRLIRQDSVSGLWLWLREPPKEKSGAQQQ